MNILIKHIDILTLQNNKIIKNGFIAIEDNIIKFIGNKIPGNFEPDNVIDGTNNIAAPGLINCHTHIPMLLLRNYADDIPLKEWLFDKIFPIEDRFTGEHVYYSSLLGIAEMIKSGITCFADMYMHMDEMAQAVFETGIRANLSRGLQCFEKKEDYSNDMRINECVSLYKKWNGEGNNRIHIGFGPHSIYTCVRSYLIECIEKAQEYDSLIHIHLAETLSEKEDCIKEHGVSPVKYLESIGLYNAKTLAAHCVHVTDDDINILRENNVNVVYNPSSNLKLGSGIAPVSKMIEKGINISLGTDGASSNNNLNMIEEMHLASLISKGVHMDTTLMKASEVLGIATKNGAKALGIDDEVGILKEGMKADITLINKESLNMYPLHNHYSALIYSAQSSNVETVIVDGKILMEKNELKTIDLEKVRYNMDKELKNIF